MGLMKRCQFPDVWSHVTSVVNKRTTRSEGPTSTAPRGQYTPHGEPILKVTNAMYLYLKGDRYESRPGQYLESATKSSFQILPNSSFHPWFYLEKQTKMWPVWTMTGFNNMFLWLWCYEARNSAEFIDHLNTHWNATRILCTTDKSAIWSVSHTQTITK
jgi:hypothetical protein